LRDPDREKREKKNENRREKEDREKKALRIAPPAR